MELSLPLGTNKGGVNGVDWASTRLGGLPLLSLVGNRAREGLKNGLILYKISLNILISIVN